MKFFADTRTKRHTACVVLLVWLFALASSVANACFLEANQAHARAIKKSAAATVQVHAASHSLFEATAGHHGGSDGTKQSCLKVCDDGTHTLPKVQAGVDHDDPGRAPLVATLWTASPQVVSAPCRLDDREIPLVGPPMRVRYARLAL